MEGESSRENKTSSKDVSFQFTKSESTKLLWLINKLTRKKKGFLMYPENRTLKQYQQYSKQVKQYQQYSKQVATILSH